MLIRSKDLATVLVSSVLVVSEDHIYLVDSVYLEAHYSLLLRVDPASPVSRIFLDDAMET